MSNLSAPAPGSAAAGRHGTSVGPADHGGHTSLAPVRALAFDVEAARADFPALGQRVHGKPLCYLDNAATTQKPAVVLAALQRAYTEQCANIHRGVHLLSSRATESFEGVRKTVQAYLHAPSADEIVFTRGTTEAINLVAASYGRHNLEPGDEILLSGLEHHSNIVPWQLAAAATGAKVVAAPLLPDGSVDMAAFAKLLHARTRIVAVSQVSNALGTVLPIQDICRLAHDAGAVVLVDGAQATPHGPVDVGALGCDFYAFSSHKVYGPTGVGVLWGKRNLLEAMPPYQGGGDMIELVTFAESTWAQVPHKFEAGTPDIAGVIGLGAALDYLLKIDWPAARAHEAALVAHACRELGAIDGLTLIGTAKDRMGVVSFTLDGVHPHDIGTILDTHGVAVRTGHHCAQPVMQYFGIGATTRASFAFYNTAAEVDALVSAVKACQAMFLAAASGVPEPSPC